jgi:hypothetical protein
MERSTSLQLNNSFLGFEIEYALCNRDKKLVFVLIHLSKLFQMQSDVVECLAPISVYFFYYIAELVLVLNMYKIFSAGFNQPTINQSINHIYGVHSSLHSTIVVIYRTKLEDAEAVIKSSKWKETLLRKTNTVTEQHEPHKKRG